MWARKLVLESFWGEAEGFLEWKECVDEEDGLRLGAERAEGKVVGFGDKPCTQQAFALSAPQERTGGGEVACFGLDEDVGEAGIGDGAVGVHEERLFVAGKLGLHPIEEMSVSVLIAVVEAIGEEDGAQCAYRSFAVGDEADGREPSEAVLERKAVGRGGEDLLSREVSLNFPPRGSAKEALLEGTAALCPLLSEGTKHAFPMELTSDELSTTEHEGLDEARRGGARYWGM